MFALEPPTDPAPDAGAEGTVEPAAPTKPGGVQGVVKNQDFIVWSLVLAGILLLAAIGFMFFDRWRKRPSGESARDTALTMSSFREMYENGELTEAEYERIKAKMAAKMREKLGVPMAPPASPPPTPDPPQPPTAPAS
jgi:uncharacterized small protein (DUF1192 family)